MEQELQKIKISQIKLKKLYEDQIEELKNKFQFVSNQTKNTHLEIEKKYLEQTKDLLEK